MTRSSINTGILIPKRTAALLLVLLVVLQCAVRAAPAVSAEEGMTVFITGSTVNVRSDAGGEYPSIGEAKSGEQYDYIAQKRDKKNVLWYCIQYTPSRIGWVTSRFSTVYNEDAAAQAVIDSIADAHNAVGAQVALIENGAVTETYNYGLTSKNGGKMESDDKIRVASLSKVFTAMNIMRLQDEAKISIDENIGTYLGTELPKPVTLRSLLSHTSSLGDLSELYPSDKAGMVYQLRERSNYSGAAVGSPGAWRYNNYGIGVAGNVAEIAINAPLDTYAHESFLDDLGIDASFRSGSVKKKNYAVTHSMPEASMKKITVDSTPGNNIKSFAGGLTISAQDYAKLIAILANDGTYDGRRYLSAEAVAAMEQPQIDRVSAHGGTFAQCLPMRYKENLYGQSRLYYHTGNAYGVLALASYNPDTRNGVVVVTTSASGARDSQGIYAVCSNITQEMYSYIENRPIDVESISLSVETVRIRKGDTFGATCSVVPAEALRQVKWSSDDPDCVYVSETGDITAVAHGTAVITATAGGKSASCTVVSAPELSFGMLGAEIRTEPEFGMRFGVSIDKDDQYKGTDVLEYGTLIIPKDMLAGGELTVDTPKAMRIPAAYKLSGVKERIIYTGALSGIPEQDYGRTVVGRGYLIYADADGTTHEIYTEPLERSFAELAETVYKRLSEKETLNKKERKMLAALAELTGHTGSDEQTGQDTITTGQDAQTAQDTITTAQDTTAQDTITTGHDTITTGHDTITTG